MVHFKIVLCITYTNENLWNKHLGFACHVILLQFWTVYTSCISTSLCSEVFISIWNKPCTVFLWILLDYTTRGSPYVASDVTVGSLVSGCRGCSGLRFADPC